MANTVTQRTLVGGGSDKRVIVLTHVVSDGATNETALVVYDNSTFINSVTKGTLEKVWVSGSTCNLTLYWDQTTDAPILTIDPVSGIGLMDYTDFGGVDNPGATGATGDIILATTSFATAGKSFTVIVQVRQD
jgi:hypothetical protein